MLTKLPRVSTSASGAIGDNRLVKERSTSAPIGVTTVAKIYTAEARQSGQRNLLRRNGRGRVALPPSVTKRLVLPSSRPCSQTSTQTTSSISTAAVATSPWSGRADATPLL